jgi:hypothetical protein
LTILTDGLTIAASMSICARLAAVWPLLAGDNRYQRPHVADNEVIAGDFAPSASHLSGAEAERSHKSLRRNETRQHRHMIDGHRKGIYARGLPHSLTFLGRNGEHARERSAGQALGEAEALRILNPDFPFGRLKRPPPMAGWRRQRSPAHKSTSSQSFAAPFQKSVALPPQRPEAIFGRGLAEKFRTGCHD